MSLGLAFWITMLVWLVFTVAVQRDAPLNWRSHGGTALVFLLFLMLGWGIFGAPIK